MKHYKLGEFADILNVSPRTLQHLDKIGVLPAKRTATNRRYYTDDDVIKYRTNKRF